MKVELSPEVKSIRPVDQLAISQAPMPQPTSGVDALAHLFSQEVASNSLPLSQRKMGARVSPVEQIAELYRQLGHPAKKTLAMISLMVREALRRGGEGGFEASLKLSEGDPARAFVVLKHVAAQADIGSRPAEAALARVAIAKLKVLYEREIQAGLNIAVAMQASGVDPQERQALRTLYYASVVMRQSLPTMMQALLGLYGSERFADGLMLMRKALADDIAAKVSSMPTPLLRTLLLGLQSCGQLSGTLNGCQKLIEDLKVDHDKVALLQRILGFTGSGLDADGILRLGMELQGNSSALPLLALNALCPVLHDLPLALWLDGRVRADTLRCLRVVIGEQDRATRNPARFSGVLEAQA